MDTSSAEGNDTLKFRKKAMHHSRRCHIMEEDDDGRNSQSEDLSLFQDTDMSELDSELDDVFTCIDMDESSTEGGNTLQLRKKTKNFSRRYQIMEEEEEEEDEGWNSRLDDCLM
jgi:hypothetical protein